MPVRPISGSYFLPTAPDSGSHGAVSGYAFTSRYQEGVGGAEDLRVKIYCDEEGNWWPLIHKGYYYLGGTQERYLFANSTSASVVLSTPVLTMSYASGYIYHLPTGTFLAVVSGSWCFAYAPCVFKAFDNSAGWTNVASTDWWYRVFTQGFVVGVRGPSGYYGARESSGDIVHKEEYWYQELTHRLWVKRRAATETEFRADLYVNWVVADPRAVDLQQQEISVVDDWGRIRTKYDHVYFTDVPDSSQMPFVPQIVAPRAQTTQSIVATGITQGNLLRPHASGGLRAGEEVAVKYYACGTFCIASGVGTTGHLKVMLPSHQVGSLTLACTLYYDDPLEDYFNVGNMAPTDASRVQLNPMLEDTDSGFLYLATRRPVAADAKVLLVSVAQGDVISGMSRMRLTVTLLDKYHNPVPTIALQHAEFNCAIQRIYPGADETTRMGRAHYLVSTSGSATGEASGYFRVTDNPGVYGEYHFYVHTPKSYLTDKEFLRPKIFLYKERSPDANGLYKVYIEMFWPDGMWVSSAWKDYTIAVVCERGSLHSENSPTNQTDGRVVTTKMGSHSSWAEVYYKPVAGDRIYAEGKISILSQYVYPRSDYLIIGEA